ncbi:MAG: exodeoxyribonuclease VII small subunit [Oscillospiraceae bacterium]|nr:exodeoxyribonuclease VII small subunit [Oscillospiraceae bacterium]MCC8079435.1 exodeoxyribonuclease VII small subunit [Oscillospiraceae bacterium]MCD7792791.1 exodeoxyribonuclease VII small subunit [Oscillospiraceae bacterium]MCD8066748.1 exodeoxyribonuclease VII small subunit [Oscillospiraceae bacterium]MCD8099970.1 exodeoxyribonuclease VII small subunit [Oscillospiraceae bacterium]
MAGKKLTFEQALERLDEIVRSLESGEAALDESMTLFTEGTKLIKQCGDMLDKAEQQVVQLQQGENGEPVELPFNVSAEK